MRRTCRRCRGTRQLAGLVEVAEPPEGFQGAVIVVGGVEAVSSCRACQPARSLGWASTACRGRARSVPVRVSPLRSSLNRALNTSGSKAGLTPLGSRRWTSRRTWVSPAANHLMTWKRVQHMAGVAKWASMAGLVGLGAVADHDLTCWHHLWPVASETLTAQPRCGAR